MLTVLTDERFSNEGWIFERKLDGERCLAFRRASELRLLSRTQQRLNDTYPELADALLARACDDFAVDGEVVAFEGAQTSFARLQQRMQLRDPERARRSGVRVFYYLFDLLHLDGHDVTGLPLRERKALLRRSLSLAEPLRGSASVPSWSATTTPVARSATPARSARGYSDAVLRDLGARLARLEQDEPPFARDKLPRSAVHWVMPELVAQIGFTDVTATASCAIRTSSGSGATNGPARWSWSARRDEGRRNLAGCTRWKRCGSRTARSPNSTRA
jgi:ATP-dependent DNA ligase